MCLFHNGENVDRELAELFCKITTKLIHSRSLCESKLITDNLNDIIEMMSQYCDSSPDNLIRKQISNILDNWQKQKKLL